MWKALTHLGLSALSIVACIFYDVNAARADEVVVLTKDNAERWGIDFQKAKSFLNRNGIQLQESEILVKFHDETSQVDLGNFDIIITTVDFAEVASVPDNGLDGGGGWGG